MADQSVFQTLRLNYLFSEEYSFPINWTYFESTIPYAMIRLIRKGSATFVIDDTVYRLQKDDIIYIPQGCKLQCEAHTDDFTFISIRFTAAFPSSDIDMWSKLVGYDMKTQCQDPQIIYYFNCIIREKDGSKRGKFLLLRGYLELILAYMIDSSDESAPERTTKPRTVNSDNKNDNRAQFIVDYMINHYDTALNVEELAKMANVSSTTLRRLFKQHTGKTPSEFLLDLKMTVAAKKIVETDERISDIAYMVGIQDPNYFTRIFKKNFGVTPYTYRERVRGL
ncbi:AraC family transcriptional regulator [Paenibacillus sp. LHD-117]|uniref:AraC family transcriptional regulator n=1 Tax=Paenibacillus sp. LHD-117 TaxID=3071412 RepID=UPI0027E07E10|nr:AraC family transcriptional regulator [Paenibacillus sp. LHD-117]MDQ6422968.1 AraC family transcriptional regulator [Paenibacillus sp. LHD-117]